jgi:hypothetical protein
MPLYTHLSATWCLPSVPFTGLAVAGPMEDVPVSLTTLSVPQVREKAPVSTTRLVVAITTVCSGAFLFLVGGFVGSTAQFGFLGMLHVLTCLTVFVVDGGRSLSVLGAYSIPHGIFVGGAAVLAPQSGEIVDSVSWSCLLALHFGYLLTVFVAASNGTTNVQRHDGELSDRTWQWFLVMLVSVFVRKFVSGGPFITAVMWCSFVCICVNSSLLYSVRRRSLQANLAVHGLPLAVFVGFVFEKNGRLMIATLGIAVLASLSVSKTVGYEKVLAVIAIPALLWVAALNRSSIDNAAGLAPRTSTVQGLASAYSPFYDFARLVRADEFQQTRRFPRQYGRTFLESSVSWVPRSIWPGKPLGLGARLTSIFLPQYSAAGHSMAALGQGEWYANFGWLGIAGFQVGSIWFIKKLQRFRDAERFFESLAHPYIWTFLTSALLDYLWVGSFTAFTRTGFSLVLFLVVNRAMTLMGQRLC